MTVFIYVDISKHVGDPRPHIKVLRIAMPLRSGSRTMTLRAWRSNMRFWCDCWLRVRDDVSL
jgi:hypothetical protein